MFAHKSVTKADADSAEANPMKQVLRQKAANNLEIF